MVAERAPATGSPPAATANTGYPVLKLETVQGQPYDLAAHRGKWVVVNFWATWCAPCIKEMPELSALDQRRDDIEVIGLAYEEIEVQAMRDFLKSARWFIPSPLSMCMRRPPTSPPRVDCP